MYTRTRRISFLLNGWLIGAIILLIMLLWSIAPSVIRATQSRALSAPLTSHQRANQVTGWWLHISASGQVWQANEATDTPTPTSIASDTPIPTETPTGDLSNLPPTSTPFPVSVSSIQGSFFPNAYPTCVFAVTTATPPAFTKVFPLISFNPPGGVGMGCTTNINEYATPFTDVIPGTPGTNCDTVRAEATVGTQYYGAGVGPLLF